MQISEKINEIKQKTTFAVINTTAEAMTKPQGKAAYIAPYMVAFGYKIMQLHPAAAGDGGDAQGMINTIMGLLGPGVIALGSLIGIVGGIQTAIGFKDQDSNGKTQGFMTLIGGAIVGAVGAIIPDSLDMGTGG